jgi:tRNA(Ile)-lysidine synthetase-like protein
MAENVPLEIRRHQLVSGVRDSIKNQNVIVGVSGGADSLALLLLCVAASMQKSSTFSVIAGHIHHGLRDESDQEQVLVESICSRFGIPCNTKRITVQAKNGSIAAGARDARYASLCEIAKKNNATTIAVAHHADDQLETMLMALCRGGGVRKLAGMSPTRTLESNILLLRPLLHVNKKVLLDICRSAHVNWCEDPTNSDSSTPRGRLRKDVVPVLRELWPSADRHASNASSMLHAAVETFQSNVPLGTSWERNSLSSLPLPVIAAALHSAVGDHATYETVQSISLAIADQSTEPRTFVCSDGCIATVTAHRVEVHYT